MALTMDRETADRGGEMVLTMDRETADRIRAEAKRFMEDYHRTFDANRGDLANLYREESVMNFEDREMVKGKEAIVAKLTSLQQFRYQISHIDCVPFVPTGGATAAQVMGDDM
ncbi:hypothetical protein NL676_019983 [Syzygium grande]|nr:hypothetical protein NL676_019983 [Syzygium grande]